MGLIRWLIKNWASTEGPTHWDLTPLVLPVSPAEAVERVRAAVACMPHWRVEPSDTPDQLRLTRRTRVFGFVDDVTLRFLPAGPGCLIHAHSKSRVGIGDLGQNRRNILELWRAVSSQLSAVSRTKRR